MELTEHDNFAETLAREIKQPIDIGSNKDAAKTRIALPPGWHLEEKDDSKLLPTPLRKYAKVRVRDTESFIEYMKRHGSLTDSTVWCLADYTQGRIAFTGIVNDHGEDADKAAWRDHLVHFSPAFSEEWNRWTGFHKKPMSQTDFASFIEDNLRDIASVEGSGLPTGSAMLEMALSFEATQDMRFKSAIRLSNGGVNLSFVQDDDAQTLQKMAVFERFAIGIPVFWSGDPYQVDARLRYRVRDGKLNFWYELVRTDKILEAASSTVIATIKDKTGAPFFFGEPFIS
ncbi:hypothetical protein AWB78_01304 [Caballeronia calidae]|uniref:DUF2303 family protein n=1 Tax=Caballeronia calidae TaxID=1777139 RepID=A0A158A5U2_9BURK|nr:DUF2303 family protein [Caballeronia calidae]SAK53211.1 hypothetical protein AWB78_01304 [Caballeronia calidae]